MDTGSGDTELPEVKIPESSKNNAINNSFAFHNNIYLVIVYFFLRYFNIKIVFDNFKIVLFDSCS